MHAVRGTCRANASVFTKAMGQKRPEAWEALRPTVALAGEGMWTEVLARLVFRSGGSAVVVSTVDDLASISHASCVVVGSPLSPADLIRATASVRQRMPLTPVIAAIQEGDPPELAADLLVVGAAAVPVDPDMHQIASWVGRYAGLNIRHTHRGILVAPVLLRSGNTLHAAIASDVSEGGLGIESVEPALAGEVEEAQFHLPGTPTPITVATRVVWVETGDLSRVRAGLRFLDLDPVDRAAIRAYQGGDDAAAPAFG